MPETNPLARVIGAARALPNLVTELRATMDSDLLTAPERSARLTDLVAYIDVHREAMRALALIEPHDLPKAYTVLQEMGVTVPHHLTGLLYHVERMSFQGLKPEQIADRIGMDPAMLKFMLSKHHDVKAAVAGGAARAADELSAAVMRKALGPEGGDLAMKLLKGKHGFEEPVAAPAAPQTVVQVNVDARPIPVDVGRVSGFAARQAALMRGEAPVATAAPLTIEGKAG